MAASSHLTIYRKYNQKVTDTEYDELVSRYAATNKQYDYSENKKAEAEYRDDIPVVMELDYDVKESEYDEKTKTWKDIKDHSIDGQRKRFQKIMRDDHSHLDELMNWDFGSSFNCLWNYWNLDGYKHKNRSKIIDRNTAQQILQACNYLLCSKWSDEMLEVLQNKWIDIIADGNDSDTYWKYVYRNNKKRLNEICTDDPDWNSVEWSIRQLKAALDAFVSLERDYNTDPVEYVLVYSVCG